MVIKFRNKELGTAAFLVQMLSNSVPKFLLPSIIFILGAVISFEQELLTELWEY